MCFRSSVNLFFSLASHGLNSLFKQKSLELCSLSLDTAGRQEPPPTSDESLSNKKALDLGRSYLCSRL